MFNSIHLLNLAKIRKFPNITDVQNMAKSIQTPEHFTFKLKLRAILICNLKTLGFNLLLNQLPRFRFKSFQMFNLAERICLNPSNQSLKVRGKTISLWIWIYAWRGFVMLKQQRAPKCSHKA